MRYRYRSIAAAFVICLLPTQGLNAQQIDVEPNPSDINPEVIYRGQNPKVVVLGQRVLRITSQCSTTGRAKRTDMIRLMREVNSMSSDPSIDLSDIQYLSHAYVELWLGSIYCR